MARKKGGGEKGGIDKGRRTPPNTTGGGERGRRTPPNTGKGTAPKKGSGK